MLWCYIGKKNGADVEDLSSNSSSDTKYTALKNQATMSSSVKRGQILVLGFFLRINEILYLQIPKIVPCTHKHQTNASFWINTGFFFPSHSDCFLPFKDRYYVSYIIIKFPPAFWNNLQSSKKGHLWFCLILWDHIPCIFQEMCFILILKQISIL